MSRVLVVGDPHLKAASLPLVVRFFDWLHRTIDELTPDYIVILGDTFHTHNVVRSEVMHIVDQHVNYIVECGYKEVILLGNHDMAHHKTPHIHAWLPYVNKFHDVIIVDQPIVYGDAAFMPYIDDPRQWQEHFDRIKDQADIVFCHQTFIGANYGFVTSKDGVPLPQWDGQIVSGHVHKSQRLGCVWYPGTPFAQEAADHDEVKGIYLYDTVDRTVNFIRSPLPQWVTSRANPSNFVEVISKMDKNDKNHLIIEGPGPEVTAAVESKHFKDLKREYGFSVKKESTSSLKSSKTLKKVATVEDAVVEYIDRIYDGSVDKAKLKSACLAALQ